MKVLAPSHRRRRRIRIKDRPKSSAKQPQHSYTKEGMVSYPSIAHQGVRVTWVDGSKLLDGPYHYNSSIIERRGELFLAFRDQDLKKSSRIGICRLRGSFYAPEDAREIILPDHWPESGVTEQREDPRLFWHDGEMWMSYCAWDRQGRIGQAIVRLDQDFRVVEEVQTFYGNNWSSGRWQKNWVFFDPSDSPGLTMVYMPAPHEVVRVNRSGSAARIALSDPVEWAWGLPRGGAPPVRHQGKWWSFFHSRLLSPPGRFRYFMGAYSFGDNYVPELVSRSPILAASADDPNRENLPLVVFPCGAVLCDGVWTVSLGVNDHSTAIAELPHAKLVEGMVSCQSK